MFSSSSLSYLSPVLSVLGPHGAVLHGHLQGQARLQGQHGRPPIATKARSLNVFIRRENMDSFEIRNQDICLMSSLLDTALCCRQENSSMKYGMDYG